jgi:phage/plasmid-like protein (TIGR03299 family)
VLYRSDTGAELGIVGDGYKIVQPIDVLEFFRSTIDDNGYKFETAGSLKGGRVIWALAATGEGAAIGGSRDIVKPYLLLSTSLDGSSATTSKFTTVRVVCNNTLTMSLGSKDQSTIKVSHRSQFNADQVKRQHGLIATPDASVDPFAQFLRGANRLANQTFTAMDADAATLALIDSKLKDPRNANGYQTIMRLFSGEGMGARMEASYSTKWGYLNAVTEYVDHHIRTRGTDTDVEATDKRLTSAWFGSGAALKDAAVALLTA